LRPFKTLNLPPNPPDLPLSTLLKHPLFHPLPSPLPPPAALAKAIRQYAPALGARLVLDEPRSFGGQRGQKEGSGGLEIGRVDGAAGRAVVDQSGSEQELARKVYVVSHSDLRCRRQQRLIRCAC
jgi:hypothetical protein